MRGQVPRIGMSSAALLGLLCLACGGGGSVQKSDVLDAEAALGMAREAVTKDRRCYDNNPAFCPNDAAQIDKLIQGVLDEKFQGRMPSKPFDVKHVGQLATGAYQKWLVSDEGRRIVEALVRSAWEMPTVKETGGDVLVAMSVLPCRLSTKLRTTDTLTCLEPDASLLDRGQPATHIVAELLDRHANSYPNAASLTVTIPMPGESSRITWQYRYDRKAGQVVVGKKSDPPTFARKAPVQNGDFGPYLSGRASLHTLDLK